MIFARRHPSYADQAHAEKRRFRRRAVGIRAKLRQSGLPQSEVDLLDLSVHGFRIETALVLSPGTRIWLTLPTLMALEAVVTWRDRYRYGCELRKPLHIAVLDHVVKRSWSAMPVTAAWHDDAPAGRRWRTAS